MKSIRSAYNELLHLTELYLLREHSLKEVRHVDPTLLAYFKEQPLRKPASPIQKQETRPLPIVPPQKPPLAPQPPSPGITQNSTIKGGKTTLDQTPPTTQSPIAEQPQKAPNPQPMTNSKEKDAPPPPPSSSTSKEWKEKRFLLEPLPAATRLDQSQWRKLCQEIFNDWPLQESIPGDTLAKKSSQAWLQSKETAPITILSFNDNPQQLHFLKNIAQAISLRLAPAQVLSAPQIEKENGWEALFQSPRLRLVIASDYGLYLHPKLMTFHQEHTQHHKHFLHKTPFLLLSDLSLYLKQPKLKPLLWRAICNEFFALPPPAPLNKES